MSDPLCYSKSRWNGWNGNECVYQKEYHKAIEYYNTAIELYPLEYRYFVNRSFCFDQLKRFELALEDAQKALLLQSDWGKCYFRKARALKGLKRFEEAELCFLKVVELEGNGCHEAHHELRTLREPVLTDSTDESVPDLNETVKSDDTSESEDKYKIKENKNLSKNVTPKSNINESENSKIEIKNVNKITASETENKTLILRDGREFSGQKNLLKDLSDYLLNENTRILFSSNEILKNPDKKYTKIEEQSAVTDNKFYKTVENEPKVNNEMKPKGNRRTAHKGMDEIVEIWDDSRNHWSPTAKSSQNMVQKSIRKPEPTNPWKFRGLYITNIKPTEDTRKLLANILSDFGKVDHIDVIPDKERAIINFDNPESPRIAMSRLQGVHIPNICVHNQKLRIRFRPLNDSTNYPSINGNTQRQLNGECYFWRTTGCNPAKYCKLKHIPVNKGVDRQPWMQNTKKFRRQPRNRFEYV